MKNTHDKISGRQMISKFQTNLDKKKYRRSENPDKSRQIQTNPDFSRKMQLFQTNPDLWEPCKKSYFESFTL